MIAVLTNFGIPNIKPNMSVLTNFSIINYISQGEGMLSNFGVNIERKDYENTILIVNN